MEQRKLRNEAEILALAGKLSGEGFLTQELRVGQTDGLERAGIRQSYKQLRGFWVVFTVRGEQKVVIVHIVLKHEEPTP